MVEQRRLHPHVACLGAVVSMCGPATCSLQGLYTLSAPDGQLNQVSDAVRTGSM
jgi:hypothetical protein